MGNEQIANRAAETIERSIRRNLPIEIALVVILIVTAAVGIWLLIAGASDQRWELLASGSACQVAVGWPVRNLVRLRQSNLILLALPALIRMAGGDEQKKLVYELVTKLIGRI